jgi:hypothetical protein
VPLALRDGAEGYGFPRSHGSSAVQISPGGGEYGPNMDGLSSSFAVVAPSAVGEAQLIGERCTLSRKVGSSGSKSLWIRILVRSSSWAVHCSPVQSSLVAGDGPCKGLTACTVRSHSNAILQTSPSPRCQWPWPPLPRYRAAGSRGGAISGGREQPVFSCSSSLASPISHRPCSRRYLRCTQPHSCLALTSCTYSWVTLHG